MTNITIITGGSEGFGRELAEHFAQDKHNLLLVARRFDLLENAKRELEGKYDVKRARGIERVLRWKPIPHRYSCKQCRNGHGRSFS